jgi:ribonuclease BN (tRNA processing enzyme)
VRLTIIGSGPARPQADTPASGILVEADGTTLLLDCGPGVVGALRRLIDPTTLSAVVIGHMHADHYLDVAPLRYLFPWGERSSRRLPVFLPPGGRARLDALATAISERAGFFDDAFEVSEYSGGVDLAIGGLHVRPFDSQHYVPAWGVEVVDGSARRIVYAGDTGPTDVLVEVARGADLLVCEATLDDPDVDDVVRGHVTADEALEMARQAGVTRTILTHYPSSLRSAISEAIDASGLDVILAAPGVSVELAARNAWPPATPDGPA